MLKNALSREKFRPREAPFRAGLRSLRARLGDRQEDMARRLSVPYNTYVRWETGTHTPRSRQLEKILALCPDEESRANFGAHFAAVDMIGARSETPQPTKPEDVRKLRARNMAMQAVQILYEQALKGDGYADSMLAKAADDLNERAGKATARRSGGKK